MSGRTKNINKSNQDEMMLGKLPPQDVELESAVLGAIMLESAAIKKSFSYSQARKLLQRIPSVNHGSLYFTFQCFTAD